MMHASEVCQGNCVCLKCMFWKVTMQSFTLKATDFAERHTNVLEYMFL